MDIPFGDWVLGVGGTDDRAGARGDELSGTLASIQVGEVERTTRIPAGRTYLIMRSCDRDAAVQGSGARRTRSGHRAALGGSRSLRFRISPSWRESSRRHRAPACTSGQRDGKTPTGAPRCVCPRRAGRHPQPIRGTRAQNGSGSPRSVSALTPGRFERLPSLIVTPLR